MMCGMPEIEPEREPEREDVEYETEIEDRQALVVRLLEEIEIEHAETLTALADR